MYVATIIVQFRAEEEAREYLQKQGINPNEFGREAFERALRELRAEQNMAEVNRMRERIKARLRGRRLFPKTAAQMVREDRDSH